MKKIFVVILLMAFVSQYSCIVDKDKYKETDVFEEFETQKGFTILHLPPVLFKFILSMEEAGSNSKDLMNKIEVIKVLFFEENDNSIKISEFKSKIETSIKEYEYNLLTQIADQDNNISIYVIDRDKVIHEVLLLIESGNEYVALNIIGELTKEEVLKVYKMVNTQNIPDIEN